MLKVLPMIEQALAELEPIPHWGKVFSLSAADSKARCSKLSYFGTLARYSIPRGAVPISF